jgi:uncharacterized protein involved in outer membrane biogenesis
MKIPTEGETPKTTLGEIHHPNLTEPFSIWPTIAGAMKSPRKFLLLTLLTLVALISVLVQSFNILASRHREQVQQELQKGLGQDVSFEALEVNLFGRPGFVAKEFRIADDPRFAATPVVRAKELILGVSVWNLFFGRLVIDSLTFNEPEFQIITNEAGLLNLTAFVNRKNELGKFPKLRPPAPERKHSPVAFAIGEVRIREGRVEYVDRSIKEPAELRVKNISMTMRELEPAQATKITIAASLSEGISQDVRIDGQLKPAPGERSWFRRAIDLSVRLDSLHVPVVARAIAGLRDKIPRELEVTGPMSFQAKLSGTPERPRIEDITLKVPLFGSSDYNAIINGSVEFSERRTWEDAQIQGGKLVVAPLALTQLRKLRLFEQNLSPLLVAAGTLSIYSRFEGTWESLRVGALVRADKAELRYKGWLNKPANVPAEVRMRISRQKQRLLLHESEFVVGAAKMDFAGSIEYEPAPRLQLKVRGKQSPVPAWGQLFTPLDFYGVGGKADWDIDFNKGLTPADENWSVRGQLKLTNSGFEHLANGRRIEKLDGQVFLDGKQARLYNVRFRLGSSMIFLDGAVANLLEPSVIYKLHSDEFNLTDLPSLDAGPPVRLKDVNANGEIQWDNGQLALTGSVTSPEGSLQQFGFGNLRCDVALSSAGLTFKNLALQTLNGTFRSDGNWASAAESSRLQMSSQVDALDLRGLIAQWIPQLKDRIEGQLNGSAQFDAAATNGAGMMSVLKGSGEASIRRGVIRDFNLVSHLLLRGSGSSVSAASTSRLPPGFAGLVKRPDTPVESLKANFAIDQRRIYTDNLIIATPDYTITGAGWLGFDRSTKWNGLIVLSPRLTQEVQRDYRIIRYLLDRRGRLGIAFVVEGKIPNVKIRLENRLLAQALRGGSAARGDDAEGGGKSNQESKDPKKWLPDALQRFLHR